MASAELPRRLKLKSKYRCIYPNCRSAYYSNITINKHFYTFPNKTRLKFRIKWLQALQIQSDTILDRQPRVCEDHFREEDFVNETRQRLNWNAVPIPVLPSITNISDEPEIGEWNDDIILDFDKAAAAAPEVPTVANLFVDDKSPNVEDDADSNGDIEVEIIYSSDEEESASIVGESDPLQLNVEIDLDKAPAIAEEFENDEQNSTDKTLNSDGKEREVSAAVPEDEESDIEVEIIYSDEELEESAAEVITVEEIRPTKPRVISPYVPRRLKFRCQYPNCRNGYYANSLNNKHFFTFPSNLEMCNKWLDAAQIPADSLLIGHRICEDHFLESSFVNSLKKRLNRNVIPIPVATNLPSSTESAAEKL